MSRSKNDQVSTKPDSTKKKVTPVTPIGVTLDSFGIGAKFMKWWKNTAAAANQRNPVRDSTRGSR